MISPKTVLQLLTILALSATTILAKQADGELQLPRPDLEKQLYTVNGYQLRKSSFSEQTQVVIVFYSASWCASCKQIAKPLKEIYPNLRKDHPEIELVTFSMNEGVSGRAEHLRKSDYPWPAIGPAAAEKEAWQIEVEGGIPQFQAFELYENGLVAITATQPADEVLQASITHLKKLGRAK